MKKQVRPVMLHSGTLPVVIEVRRTKDDPQAIVVLLKTGPRRVKRRATR